MRNDLVVFEHPKERAVTVRQRMPATGVMLARTLVATHAQAEHKLATRTGSLENGGRSRTALSVAPATAAFATASTLRSQPRIC